MKKRCEKERCAKHSWSSVLPKTIGIAFWVCLVLVCFIYRDEITVESIVNFTPENPVFAICIILMLFALKSVSMVIYGGILYVVSGILFSLPTAIAVNLIGGIIMTSIPFWIGKRSGAKLMDHLVQRNPKLELLRTLPQKNEWFVSFFVRIVGGLPGDLVSMYLGSSSLHYIRYICGTMMGLFPSIIIFSVMGMSINDVSSPAFKISIVCKIGLTALSLILCFVWEKRRTRNADHEYHTK